MSAMLLSSGLLPLLLLIILPLSRVVGAVALPCYLPNDATLPFPSDIPCQHRAAAIEHSFSTITLPQSVPAPTDLTGETVSLITNSRLVTATAMVTSSLDPTKSSSASSSSASALGDTIYEMTTTVTISNCPTGTASPQDLSVMPAAMGVGTFDTAQKAGLGMGITLAVLLVAFAVVAVVRCMKRKRARVRLRLPSREIRMVKEMRQVFAHPYKKIEAGSPEPEGSWKDIEVTHNLPQWRDMDKPLGQVRLEKPARTAWIRPAMGVAELEADACPCTRPSGRRSRGRELRVSGMNFF